MTFIFRDGNNKEHRKTTKMTSCTYSFQFIKGVKKLVITDYFNKKINQFTIPENWLFVRVEH